ncbi:MAG TPA: HYR domain-containing protein, partial [Phnomibacter sp.]|nr:HYR domain-containing protein [Phnomibacter sp.]
ATDANGNASEPCSFTVTVADDQKPVITVCAGPQSANVGSENCTAPVPNFTSGVTATDNCTLSGSLTITQSPLAGAQLGVGVHTITITVADQAGNEETCTTTFTVTDNIKPVIVTCPAPQSANANNNCLAPVPNFVPGVVATDNCSSAGNLTITQSPVAGTLVGLGTTTVTITVRDAANNEVTCTTTFTVADNTPPSITCPANITTPDDGCGTVILAIGTPNANDNCGSATVAGVRSDGKPLGDPYPIGVTTITWTATDLAGLTNSCNQTITVTKSEGTILVNYTFEGMNGFPFNANETATGITSNVNSSENFSPQNNGTSTGPLAFKQNPGTNTFLNMQPSSGENTRFFEFVINGTNLKFYSQFKIYFQGSRQPQAANKINVAYSTDGVNYTFNGSLDIPLQREWYEALIDYSGIAALNGNDLEKLYIRLYASGSSSTSNSDATRLEVDNFQVFAKSVGSVINCNPDIVADVASPADCSANVQVTAPTAQSPCGDVTVTGVRSDGKAIGDPYPSGITTITWTATDAAGNTANCSQTVTVNGAAGGIVAVDDLFSVSQGTASTAGNVLENDLLDCKPATTGNVTISEVTGA